MCLEPVHPRQGPKQRGLCTSLNCPHSCPQDTGLQLTSDAPGITHPLYFQLGSRQHLMQLLTWHCWSAGAASPQGRAGCGSAVPTLALPPLPELSGDVEGWCQPGEPEHLQCNTVRCLCNRSGIHHVLDLSPRNNLSRRVDLSVIVAEPSEDWEGWFWYKLRSL